MQKTASGPGSQPVAIVSAETSVVRPGEELDLGALSDYLRGKLEGVDQTLAVEQFPSGHSNLTYLLRAGGREYVLRRGPLGPVAPKAHDMAREYRVLQAIHPHFSEAPDVYLLCEDPAVLGAVFFIMERRRGIVLRDSIPSAISAMPDHSKRISQAAVECLARLHAVSVCTTGLAALGKPEGFLERQVHGWADRWRRAQTESMPQIDEVVFWLERHMPISPPPAIVHNDYKLDNLMIRAGAPQTIEAVLDWEMATVGDPLADVGLALCYWWWASAPAMRARALPALTSLPGWYTRDQFVSRYAELTGRDLAQLAYYEVLGIFKLAVILQQIYFRFRRGQTQDQRFRDFDQRVRALAELAASLAERHG